MAEIKCPVCGTNNDEMAEECRSCGAFLKVFQTDGEQTAPPIPTEDLLARLREAGTVPVQPGSQDEPADEDADQNEEIVPYWLKELDTWQEKANAGKLLSEEEPVVPAEEVKPAVDEGLLPDWLKSRVSETTDQPQDQALPAASLTDEELSDWLSSYQEQAAAQADLPIEEPERLKSGNIIELPASFVDPSETETPPPGDEKQGGPSEAHSLPEWLSGEEDTTEESAGIQPIPQQPDENTSSEEIDLIEWLSDLRAEDFPTVFEGDTEQTPATGQPQPAIPPFVGDDMGEWMDPSQPDAQSGPQGSQEGKPSSLPEWMDDITPGPGAGEPAQPASLGENPLEPELPGWLAALQPDPLNLADQQTSIDDSIVEESGPLAGIPGVLPSQDVSSLYRKPPVYSSQLQVSEKQRAHAAMLANLLDEEKQKVRPKRSLRMPSQVIARALVALLLIAVVLLPLLGFNDPALQALTGFGSSSVAGDAGAVSLFHQVIEDLPSGSSVLIAVEYAPGFDGEMSIAAVSVLERLMEREMRIAVVSTTPSGPLLAEGLKLDAFTAFPDLQERYNQRDWFINLGYLPGETLSLQELVRSPQQAVRYGISAGMENRLVWDSAVLQNITRLEDFSLLVLITDTAENGRAWIEQVQTPLQDAQQDAQQEAVLNTRRSMPFLIIASAQAAPMLQPYVSSGQVQGMVTGMAGGLDLAGRTQHQTDRSSALMLSIRLGAAAVVFLILFGIIVEGFSSLFGRNRSGQEA